MGDMNGYKELIKAQKKVISLTPKKTQDDLIKLFGEYRKLGEFYIRAGAFNDADKTAHDMFKIAKKVSDKYSKIEGLRLACEFEMFRAGICECDSPAYDEPIAAAPEYYHAATGYAEKVVASDPSTKSRRALAAAYEARAALYVRILNYKLAWEDASKAYELRQKLSQEIQQNGPSVSSPSANSSSAAVSWAPANFRKLPTISTAAWLIAKNSSTAILPSRTSQNSAASIT